MVSKVWKAGGEETDHSNVLSSAPQGLLEVLRFFTKASIITTKNNTVVWFERHLKVNDLGIISDKKIRGEVYAGLCIAKKKCLDTFDWDNCFDFETDLFNKYIQDGKVGQIQINGTWYPIDTPKHLQAVNKNISNILGIKGHKYFQIN